MFLKVKWLERLEQIAKEPLVSSIGPKLIHFKLNNNMNGNNRKHFDTVRPIRLIYTHRIISTASKDKGKDYLILR